MPYTYDRSVELQLALVAEADLSGACYVALADAPTALGQAERPYLRQMHAVANSVSSGITVMTRRPFKPEQWERL